MLFAWSSTTLLWNTTHIGPPPVDRRPLIFALRINSAAVLAKITDLQPHGQRDKRTSIILSGRCRSPNTTTPTATPRPRRRRDSCRSHCRRCRIDDTQHFTAKRRAIRAALVADGIAAEMEALVDALLPP